jgi:hypothetical protein
MPMSSSSLRSITTMACRCLGVLSLQVRMPGRAYPRNLLPHVVPLPIV